MDKQKKIEEIADALYNSQYEYDLSNPFEVAKVVINLGYRKIPENGVVLTREEYDELKERIDELEQLLLVTKTNAKLTHKKEIELFAEKLKRKHHEYYRNVPYEEFVKANIVCGDIDEICKEMVEGK